MFRIKLLFGLRFFRKFVKQISNSFKLMGQFEGALNIIVNGPSLIKDVEKIDLNIETLVVNQFVRHDLFLELKPRFYLIQDPYFWNQNVFNHWTEKRNLTFKLLNQKVKWDMYLIIPRGANLKLIRSYLNNRHIHIIDYNDSSYEKPIESKRYSRLEKYLLCKNYISPSPSNVLLTSLYVGSIMGYKNLLIYGADMSFFKSLSVNQHNNAVGINEKHFYGDEFFEISESKSFKMKTTLSKQLMKWSHIFKDLERLSDYFISRNVKAVNRSEFSYIDSFSRNND